MKDTDIQIFDSVIQYYSGYAERNDTLRAFIYDVDTLGGTLLTSDTTVVETWWIETNTSCSIVSDSEFNEQYRFPLKDIFLHLKSQQLMLF